MDIATYSLIIIAAVAGLLALGVPFGFAAGAVAVVIAFVEFGPDSMFLISSRTFDLANNFNLIAVPMFLLMASILERSGIAQDLYSVLHRRLIRVRAGVGMATMVIALILGATTGIVGGEIVLLGLVALPQMLRLGYQRRLAMGLVCAGGSLGTMMPPSLVLIFYGISTGVPIGDLFLASATPALILAILYMAYIRIRGEFKPALVGADGDQAAQMAGLEDAPRGWQAVIMVGTPLLIAMGVLGSIYAGVASVTESAAMGVAGVLFATWLRGELSWDLLTASLRRTLTATGIVLWLVFGTNALIGLYNALGGIGYAQGLLTGIAEDRWTLILLAMTVFLVMGFLLDWTAILFLTMPIFAPLLDQYSIDKIWFGILFNLTVQTAYLTPPMGPACFYLKSVAPADVTLREIFSAMWPFVGLQIIGLMLVVLIPDLSLWLPRLLSG